ECAAIRRASRASREGAHRNQRINHMHLRKNQAARCLARTRRGSPYRSPAMRDCRCRMHGGLSTGAPRGNRNAFKHGLYSAKAIARRREVAALLQAMRELVGAAGELEIGGVGTSK